MKETPDIYIENMTVNIGRGDAAEDGLDVITGDDACSVAIGIEAAVKDLKKQMDDRRRTLCRKLVKEQGLTEEQADGAYEAVLDWLREE